jgi:hypothetical protein
LPRGSVQGVLAYTQNSGGFFRSDEVSGPALYGERDRESLHVPRIEPTVSAASDDGRQHAVVDGADNGRPANAKTLCCIV